MVSLGVVLPPPGHRRYYTPSGAGTIWAQARLGSLEKTLMSKR